jgi:hypothetical protein
VNPESGEAANLQQLLVMPAQKREARLTRVRADVAGIHVFLLRDHKDVDGRDKPGHDDAETPAPTSGIVKCDSPAE